MLMLAFRGPVSLEYEFKIPRLRECTGQVEAEMVCNSSSKIHQTWEVLFWRPLYFSTFYFETEKNPQCSSSMSYATEGRKVGKKVGHLVCLKPRDRYHLLLTSYRWVRLCEIVHIIYL